MIYSIEATQLRDNNRYYTKLMHKVHRHFAIKGTKCACCGREVKNEWVMRYKDDMVMYVIVRDYCHECAPTKFDVARKIDEERR